MTQTPNPYSSPTAESLSAHFQDKSSPDAAALRTTAIGLGAIYYGVVLILLAIIGFVVLSVVLANMRLLHEVAIEHILRAPPMVLVAVGGIGLIGIIGYLMCLVGPFICLAAPAESGGVGFLVASLVLECLDFIYHVLNYAVLDFHSAILLLIFAILGFVSNICFLLFLKRLAEYVDCFHLSEVVTNILIGGGAMFALYVLWFMAALAQLTLLAVPLTLAIAITGLVLFVMYLNLLNNLRKELLGSDGSRRKQGRGHGNKPSAAAWLVASQKIMRYVA